MPNRIEARSAKAALTNATGRLPLLRLFSTPLVMVPKKGLEPPHPCGYMDLNHARLPIPPLRLVVRSAAHATHFRKNNPLFYRR